MSSRSRSVSRNPLPPQPHDCIGSFDVNGRVYRVRITPLRLFVRGMDVPAEEFDSYTDREGAEIIIRDSLSSAAVARRVAGALPIAWNFEPGRPAPAGTVVLKDRRRDARRPRRRKGGDHA